MIKAGIIGCGVMGKIHAESLVLSGAGIPASFHDTSLERSEELARIFNGKAYKELDDLLNEDELDCIYICTHHDSHLNLIERVIAHHKPIFCEKPLAVTLQDSIYIHDLVIKQQQPFFLGFNQRYSPGTIRIKEIIKSYNPTVINLSLSCCDFLQHWMGKPVIGGGVLPSLAVHAFDLIRFIFDEFDYLGCITDRLRLGEGYLDDCGAVSFKLRHGILGSMTFHDHSNLKYQQQPGMNMYDLEIHTRENCTLICNINKRISIYTPDKVSMEEYESNSILYAWGYIDMNRAFIDMITHQNDNPYPSAEDGLVAARLIDDAARSNKKREFIRCT